MLILTRKLGEAVSIGSNIKVVVMQIRNKYVRLGIDAKSSVVIHREEVYEKIFKENQIAADSSKNYKKSYPPSKKFLNKISSMHTGYRTVFTWYMWRSIDPVDVEY